MQGCKATICMPVSTPDIKVSNVRRLGGEVELVGESYQETQAHAVQVIAGRSSGLEGWRAGRQSGGGWRELY
jgi:threonine dehydratase